MSPEPSSANLKNRRKQPQLVEDKDSDTQSIGGSIPSDAPKRKKHQCSFILSKGWTGHNKFKQFWKSFTIAISN
ncbi:hypothetical protein BKA82DRAFT_32481 [Pisolithus tinctorius]|uniref:Uncharacterized protein n=1 Tax=Pisolithus tinctorius Marx 270 TaxID=870435 RepID=A0A0C3JI44_PISTI|nr:hypothetical protein BKA82DRAFT_32481 [Pisolithus tinctorius]KIN97266.1 hypothetical protein M404DRAFT_32481 [Pisolithus tinctorius Marx 270]